MAAAYNSASLSPTCLLKDEASVGLWEPASEGVCVCVCVYAFIHSLCIHTVTHAHCGFTQIVRPASPTVHTHTHTFTHILKAGGSVAMATGRTAASAAAAIEPDET